MLQSCGTRQFNTAAALSPIYFYNNSSMLLSGFAYEDYTQQRKLEHHLEYIWVFESVSFARSRDQQQTTQEGICLFSYCLSVQFAELSLQFVI